MTAVLLDIDGVLTVAWRPIPGAVEAVTRLRADGHDLLLLTNTTSRTKADITGALVAAGFPVGPADVMTATTATAAFLAEHHPDARVFLLNGGDVTADLPGVRLVDDAPDVVVVGGAGPAFDYPTVDRVFGFLNDGAHLVAMARNLSWRTADGLSLDAGAYLLGWEAAAGVRAEVIGKPSPAFFHAALARLGADTGVMVGDDLEADVLGAQRAGLTGVQVRTGKFREKDLAAAFAAPDHVIDSVADLPALLDSRSTS
ncbi:HAD superfamily hydrolase (TIGR01458 family) [Actinocorallia herbida]|uniref:HAD superfamily hydrolase (TIGR01458 family) n=1 Tax=Actinocorallia herbida TaxID=58109 RepID=A0A3N1DAC2_9ACTN|nr:HAD-IIA family hydrolase [Actinocorallia herbida]ROO90482.1 HAD superfamily hydrolase (TIGR01458 family) [Actinocorallia herbida]